jgi:excisionase family DNA binding protein
MLQPVPPILLSVDDTCTALGVGRSLVYQLIASGELESVTLGRRRLVPARSVDDYVDRLRASCPCGSHSDCA